MDGITKNLQTDIIRKSEAIAKILRSGHDVELRKDVGGKVKVIEVRKTAK